MSEPKLWLSSMSHGGLTTLENAREIIEPIHSLIDGVMWVLHDTDPSDPAARYLESVKGAGRIIYRPWPRGRHFHSMNDTLWCGPMDDGDYCLWIDPLERAQPPFVSRIKSEIGPMMAESETELIVYFGKPYLFRYRETLEYRNTPHWTLTGWRGRAVEWSTIEPDEKQVRWNVRPLKRQEPLHWVRHLLRYFIEMPEGANSALLGLDHWPGGQTQENWNRRESNRLALRAEMKKRGYPLTVQGFIDMCSSGPDETLKGFLRAEKTFSDGYHYLVCGRTDVIDNHNPAKAIPIE